MTTTQSISKHDIYLEHRKLNKKQITIQQWWKFIEDADEDLVREVVKESLKAEDRLKEYKNSPRFRNKIRKYANFYGYSDVEPYEVVNVISPITVEVRAMETNQLTGPEGFAEGGFSGHYSNQHAQSYEYISNPSNPTVRIRLTKKGWRRGHSIFVMSDNPYKFYDYNF